MGVGYDKIGDINNVNDNPAFNSLTRASKHSKNNQGYTTQEMRKRAQNTAMAENTWRQQAIDEQNYLNSRFETTKGIQNATREGLQGYDNARGLYDSHKADLQGREIQQRSDLTSGFTDARAQYDPMRQFGDTAGNWLMETLGDANKWQDYQVGAKADSWFDDRAEKQAASVQNARGNLGVAGGASIEQARHASAISRQMASEEAYERDRTLGQYFNTAGNQAREAQANLHSAQGTALSNVGTQYSNYLGNINNNQANNALGRGNFLASMAGMEGQNQAGFRNQMAGQSRSDYDKWWQQTENTNQWSANAGLQQYFQQKQMEAADKSSTNSLFAGLATGAAKMGASYLTGGLSSALTG